MKITTKQIGTYLGGILLTACVILMSSQFLGKNLQGAFNIASIDTPTANYYIHMPNMSGEAGDANYDSDFDNIEDSLKFHIYMQGEAPTSGFEFDLSFPPVFNNQISASVNFTTTIDGTPSGTPVTISAPGQIPFVDNTNSVIQFSQNLGGNTYPISLNQMNSIIPVMTRYPIAEITINRSLIASDAPGYFNNNCTTGNCFSLSNAKLYYSGQPTAFPLQSNNLFNGDIEVISNHSSTAIINQFDFDINNQTGSNEGKIFATGDIDQYDKTITLIVPYGTNTQLLVPTIQTDEPDLDLFWGNTSNAPQYQTNASVDMLDPLIISVQAPDGTIIPYTVTVIVQPAPPLFYDGLTNTANQIPNDNVYTYSPVIADARCVGGGSFFIHDQNTIIPSGWSDGFSIQNDGPISLNGICRNVYNNQNIDSSIRTIDFYIDTTPPDITEPNDITISATNILNNYC
jgi:hypothetical protein